MTKPGPTKKDYDSLIYKLATLESELGYARKLLEDPARVGWWRRLWGVVVVVALVVNLKRWVTLLKLRSPAFSWANAA